MKTIFFLLLSLTSISFALQGFDVSIYQGSLSVDDFSCLIKEGYNLLILQVWSNEGFNQYFPSNYNNSQLASLSNIDIYASICSECPNNDPETLCNDIYNAVPQGFNGQLWLDVFPCEGCWSENASRNLMFINDVAQSCINKGFDVGIYSSYSAWGAVLSFVEYCTPLLSSLDLWYVHYDNDAGFDDFPQVKFGSWTNPTMKQYIGGENICGILVDVNFSN